MQERHWRKLQNQKVNNQYHLQEFLGCGGYGAVYKADEVIRERFIREVAIKLITPAEDETKAEKQLTELQAAVNLQHEHLIRSYTAGSCEVKEEEYLFIVMEIAETTLEKKLKTGKIPPAEAIEIVKATAAALNYLHKSNPRKVHRDIKPANLLYAEDKWKVSDFGLLREINTTKSVIVTKDMRGTPSYVPPESYDGEVGTAGEGDMWSLGVMTAEILTGIMPFSADTAAQLMKKIMYEQPEIEWSKIPEPFTAIVRGCLEKKRGERWTAEQVLTVLAPKKPVVEFLHPSDFLASDFLSPERSRRATPEPSPPPLPQLGLWATPGINRKPPETTPLISAVGMDYINLRNFLAAKKWKEANEETARVMLKVADREKEGCLDTESIEKFPHEDLGTIDQLWVKYSKGRFGFSVQKRIYESLGGTVKYDSEVWRKFGDKVGWRKKNWRLKQEWLYDKDLTFSEKAPEAHLPVVRISLFFRSALGRRGMRGHSLFLYGYDKRDRWSTMRLLFSRVETCRL